MRRNGVVPDNLHVISQSDFIDRDYTDLLGLPLGTGYVFTSYNILPGQ